MFGNVVLSVWPLVVFVMFRKLAWPRALLLSILLGYLFLPTRFGLDLPLLPTLDKATIPALSALAAVLVLGARGDARMRPGWLPAGIVPKLLLTGLFAGAFLTVMSNGDTLVHGATVLPALRPFDAFATILALATTFVPLLLARKLLATPEAQREVLVVLVAAGLVYTLLALYEIRMSPQLNRMVYGFFPHSWEQHLRAGGYRPLVFLNHGLWLAIFFAVTILAAFGLSTIRGEAHRGRYLLAGGWLLMTLALSNSLGALAIVVALLPAVFLLGRRMQLVVASALALVVLIYPMLRGAHLVPIEFLLDWANGISPDRANSLAFRLRNEEILLDKASLRALFGWGGWGRNFVYDEAGRSIAVTDGYWILIIGLGGWVRYLTEFGLLCMPVVLALANARKYALGRESAILALALAANLLDLIPNATVTPVTWLLAGALWGRLELGRVEAGAAIPDRPAPSRALAYSRFRPPQAPPDPAPTATPRAPGKDKGPRRAARKPATPRPGRPA